MYLLAFTGIADPLDVTFAASKAIAVSVLPHSIQMQVLLQGTDASKHSQYFLRHMLFRHLHPLLCAAFAF